MGTSSQEDMQNATQLKGPIMPITQAVNTIEFVDVTDEMKESSAYLQMRGARNKARTWSKSQSCHSCCRSRQSQFQKEEEEEVKGLLGFKVLVFVFVSFVKKRGRNIYCPAA